VLLARRFARPALRHGDRLWSHFIAKNDDYGPKQRLAEAPCATFGAPNPHRTSDGVLVPVAVRPAWSISVERLQLVELACCERARWEYDMDHRSSWAAGEGVFARLERLGSLRAGSQVIRAHSMR
jgi:hypothetical protein